MADNKNVIQCQLSINLLENRWSIADSKFICKITNNLVGTTEMNKLNYFVSIHNIRNNTVYYQQTNINYYVNSPVHRCIQSYNSYTNYTTVDIFNTSKEAS